MASIFVTKPVDHNQGLYSRRWWGLAVLCLSLMIILMANLSISVGAMSLTESFTLTSSQLQWIIDAYTVPYASLMLFISMLGDKYGRRLALVIGLLILTVGAAYGGFFSHSAHDLMIARAVMGIGAAFIMPSTLSLLVVMFPRNERSIAITIWASTSGIAMVMGPLVAGYLMKFFSWDVIFTMNIPPALVMILLTFIFVPPSKAIHHTSIDFLGGLLSTLWVGSIVYSAIEGPHKGWHEKTVVAALIAGVIGFILFIIWELIWKHPLIDLRKFRSRFFTGSALGVAGLMFVVFGVFLALIENFQFIYLLDPFQTGVRLLPLVGTVTLGAGITGYLTRKIGVKFTMPIAFLVVLGALFMFYQLGDHPEYNKYSYIVIPLCLIGFSIGFGAAPATEYLMGSFSEARLGVGGAVNDTAIELFGSIGVAVLGSVIGNEYTRRITAVIDQLKDQLRQQFTPETLAQLPPEQQQKIAEGLKKAATAEPLIKESVGAGAMAAVKTQGMPFHDTLAQGVNTSFAQALSKMSLTGIVVMGVLTVVIFLLFPFGRGTVEHNLVTENKVFTKHELEEITSAEIAEKILAGELSEEEIQEIESPTNQIRAGDHLLTVHHEHDEEDRDEDEEKDERIHLTSEGVTGSGIYHDPADFSDAFAEPALQYEEQSPSTSFAQPLTEQENPITGAFDTSFFAAQKKTTDGHKDNSVSASEDTSTGSSAELDYEDLGHIRSNDTDKQELATTVIPTPGKKGIRKITETFSRHHHHEKHQPEDTDITSVVDLSRASEKPEGAQNVEQDHTTVTPVHYAFAAPHHDGADVSELSDTDSPEEGTSIEEDEFELLPHSSRQILDQTNPGYDSAPEQSSQHGEESRSSLQPLPDTQYGERHTAELDNATEFIPASLTTDAEKITGSELANSSEETLRVDPAFDQPGHEFSDPLHLNDNDLPEPVDPQEISSQLSSPILSRPDNEQSSQDVNRPQGTSVSIPEAEHEYDTSYYQLLAAENAHLAAEHEEASSQDASKAHIYAAQARAFAARANLNAAKAEAYARQAEEYSDKAGIAPKGSHSSRTSVHVSDLLKNRLESMKRDKNG